MSIASPQSFAAEGACSVCGLVVPLGTPSCSNCGAHFETRSATELTRRSWTERAARSAHLAWRIVAVLGSFLNWAMVVTLTYHSLDPSSASEPMTNAQARIVFGIALAGTILTAILFRHMASVFGYVLGLAVGFPPAMLAILFTANGSLGALIWIATPPVLSMAGELWIRSVKSRP